MSMLPPIRRRAFVVGGCMLGSSALAYVATPRIHIADQIGQPDLETLFPREFGEWRVDPTVGVVLPSPDVQALLDKLYNQVLARTYINRQGQRIMLSVAYGGDQSDGTRAHRPEVCYPAQGFQITANRRSEMAIEGRRFAVRELMSRLGGRHEPITYWVVVGGEVTTSGTEQKLAQLRYGVRGLIPDGLLVRVSNIEPSMEKGLALQRSFMKEMAAVMPEAGRDRVFGEVAAPSAA
jgi:EpsI family protein